MNSNNDYVTVPRAQLQYIRDLLTEKVYGSSARSPGHNARLVVDDLLSVQMEAAGQQLVARIKRSSKYYGQTAPNAWFDVLVCGDRSYRLRGNSNNYRTSDVVFGIRLDSGEIVELK